MEKRREVRVKAVGTPTRGMFRGELMPNEWLSYVDEIAEKWARRSFLQPAAAKGLIGILSGVSGRFAYLIKYANSLF